MGVMGIMGNLRIMGKPIKLFGQQSGYSGLGDTLVEGTMENRYRQMSSSLEYLPISIFYRNNYKLFLNPQTK